MTNREFEYADHGVWIHRTSEAAGESIIAAVRQFRALHKLEEADWHLRIYGVSSIYLDIWIGDPRRPTFREPYTIIDDGAAGQKVTDIIEHLYIAWAKAIMDAEERALLQMIHESGSIRVTQDNEARLERLTYRGLLDCAYGRDAPERNGRKRYRLTDTGRATLSLPSA